MKKIFIIIIAITLTFNMLATNVWDGSSEPWSNGNGTQYDPYLIETAANLAFLAEKVNEGYQTTGQNVFSNTYFLLTDDLDLNNINWTPIGIVNSSMEGFYFAGIFDGDYHTINNLKITTSAEICGLFAAAATGTVIKHVFVTNAIINSTGTGAAGLVGGTANDALIYQCGFSGNITVNNNGSYSGAGGVTAVAAGSTIKECYVSGSINVTNNGGFTSAAGAGGIVGVAIENAVISQCYNTSTVTASAMLISVAAGIVAATLEDGNPTISSCYNTGTINAATKGGIFGMVSPINPMKSQTAIDVTNCFYLNTCGGNTTYGTSMTSNEMQTEQFKNQLDQNTHSFVMDNGTNNGYPILGLTDFVLYDASDITFNSAKLSAKIHQGNNAFSRVYFYLYKEDNTDYQEVDVDTDGYVEAILENLEENTTYLFGMNLMFNDESFISSGEPKWFKTTINGTDELSSSNVQVYPNPTSDFIYIENIDYQLVKIYSLDGKLIKTIENDRAIDVRDLNEGLYLINIDGMTSKFSVRRVR